MHNYVDSPFLDVLVNLLLDIISYLLSLLEEVLKYELSASVLEDGVGDLSDSQTEVLHSVIGKSGIDDPVVDSGIDVDGHVIFCYHVLCDRIDT